MNIPYIDLSKPNVSRGSHRTERYIAQAIAYPITLMLVILFYLLKLLTKLLYKAKRWLARAAIFAVIFFIAGSNLTLNVAAPKAHAALDQKVIVTPLPKAPSQEDIILGKPQGVILFRIWTLESSRGQNGRIECEAQGERNDFGYNVANHQCFGSFAAELDAVSAWFDATLKTHPLANSLCIYNEGVDRSDCPYAKHFMSI